MQRRAPTRRRVQGRRRTYDTGALSDCGAILIQHLNFAFEIPTTV